MCAIVGFWDSCRNAVREELERTALQMAAAVRHRGPDDQGAWAEEEPSIALGHRRLSILDLSSEGHQPMISPDQRYVLVFNGEIYNYKSLRSELEQHGHTFRGHSDTEVLLAAVSQWGLVPALERFVGMFAFALWDRQLRKLHLARDRAGEKPLYYGWSDGVFLFGSELKALRAHPEWSARINRQAVAMLAQCGYIPAPHSIYEQIHKLPPGCVLTISESDIQARQTRGPTRFWSAAEIAVAGARDPFRGSPEEARDQLKEMLREAVRQQMVADVPLGAFLSGGIDSALVVALMQSQSGRPTRTFSIGYHQDDFNEAPFAKAVAAHLGTDHTEWYVQDQDLHQVVPRLPGIYDEPLADASQVPTVLLCQLAGSRVKVSLSGDAGDELFGGYNAYRKAQQVWSALRRIPRSVRQRLALGLKSFSGASLHHEFVPGNARRLLQRVSNLAELLPSPTDQSLYRALMALNRDPQSWLCDAVPAEPLSEPDATWDHLPELLQRMTSLDFASYLPDDILVKVDRAAMSVALETRIPLLDHRVIEFAWRLPVSFKQKGSQGKWLLRQILHELVPQNLVDRPKRGFAAPIAGWLRGSLREWAGQLLEQTRLRREGFFDFRKIGRSWEEHVSRKRDWSSELWPVLMFQAWLDEHNRVSSRVEPLPAHRAANLIEASA